MRTIEDIAAALQEPRLASHSGRLIRCSSLRPLDVLEVDGIGRETFVVVQNSARLRKVEIVSVVAPFLPSVAGYEHLSAMRYDFVGRARKRPWLRFLPPFARALLCPFSLP